MRNPKLRAGFFLGNQQLAARPEIYAAAKKLNELGAQIITDDLLLASQLSLTPLTRHKAIQSSDICLAFGGDGTILTVARDAALSDIPVLGINFGQLGFLAEVSGGAELMDFLDRLILGEYSVENRHMLMAKSGDQCIFALNDIVIRRESTMAVLRSRVQIDGELLDDYVADGLLVSTSTGSTAYALSCGGPIVAPGVELMIFTPICPHSLRARPVIVADTQQISVRVFERSLPAFACADGHEIMAVDGGEVVIERAKQDAKFIRFGNSRSGFFTKVHQRLVDRTMG